MADSSSSSNTGIVAVVVIFVVIVLAIGAFAFRDRIFSGGGAEKTVDINVTLPSK